MTIISRVQSPGMRCRRLQTTFGVGGHDTACSPFWGPDSQAYPWAHKWEIVPGMTEKQPESLSTGGLGPSMQGRQLFAYFALLFLFLILGREFLIEVDSRFDLNTFPKLAAGIKQALDDASEFDNIVNTVYSLMYAFLFSLPVAIVYRITKDEEDFDPSLGQTIVLLAMAVTAVITVVAGDTARAFALAGVVAAVRFRNSLNDAKDAVYVFLSIAIGIACRARVYSTALWTSVVMSGALYFFWRYRFGELHDRLITNAPEGFNEKRERKEKAGKKKRSGEEAQILVPSLSAEAHRRVERRIEQQHRLVQMAVMSRAPDEKKLNAGLVVEALQVAQALGHVEGLLASSSGKWRLANVTAREGGAGTIEFVGRLSKGEAPGALVQALLVGAQAAAIETVEFRSLKGQTDVVASAKDRAAAPPETTGGAD